MDNIIRGQDCPWKSQSEWQRTEINGESTSMVWQTIGSRSAKKQKRTGRSTAKSAGLIWGVWIHSQLPSADCAFIKWTTWTLYVYGHDDNTKNIDNGTTATATTTITTTTTTCNATHSFWVLGSLQIYQQFHGEQISIIGQHSTKLLAWVGQWLFDWEWPGFSAHPVALAKGNLKYT